MTDLTVTDVEKILNAYYIALSKINGVHNKLIDSLETPEIEFEESDIDNIKWEADCDDPYEVPFDIIVNAYNKKYAKRYVNYYELYVRIDFAVSFAWKYMLQEICTKSEYSKLHTDHLSNVMDMINLAYIYFREGYKYLTEDDVAKYYENNKEKLYQEAIQHLCIDVCYYEYANKDLAFTNPVPYPLPEDFDFLKLNRNRFITCFQNKLYDTIDSNLMDSIQALSNLPKDLSASIIAKAVAASEILHPKLS